MLTPNIFKRALFMLPTRLLLFAGIQALFAFGFYVFGIKESWNASANWWPIIVGLANLVCLAILLFFYRTEGESFWILFRFHKESVGKDLLILLGFLVLAAPLSYLPNILLGKLLFGDPNTTLELFIRPLPMWAVYVSIVFFSVTQGIIEIPTYMLYIMPRLEKGGMKPWMAVLLPTIFLSAQHIAVPLLFNGQFILWRLFMFLPFAFLVAIMIKARPRLMPYVAIVHILLDASTALMLLQFGY